MVLTIVEYAKLALNNGEDKKAGLVMTFAESSPFLRRAPILSVLGNSYAFTREAVLPTVGFRKVGAAYTENSGKVETKTEVLKLVGGDLDVDRFLVQTNGSQIRTAHERMKATALGQTIGLKCFKGSTSTDPTEFDGIQTRTGGDTPTASTQVLDMGTGALSMKKLDQAIDLVDSAIGPKIIVGPQAMRRNITAFLRGSGTAVIMRPDEFGNQVTTYGGLDWVDADQNGNQAGIAFDEQSSTTTSVYVIALGTNGVHLIDNGGISVRDLGEINTSPVFRTRVEWYVSLADEHPRCISRIFGITDAVAVA